MAPPQAAASLIAAGNALGLTREELLAALLETPSEPTRDLPTVAEYTPKVRAASRAGSLRTYGAYWAKFEAEFGTRRLDEFTVTDLRAFIEKVRLGSLRRRGSIDGAGAAENAIGALRRLFTCAMDDGYVLANPALKIPKPARHPSRRRALSDEELTALAQATQTRSKDPGLDLLLMRFHLEAGARRGGALALTGADLDRTHARVRLHEKGGTAWWQPVSPTLIAALVAHAEARGTLAADQPVFYLSSGTPLPSRHYDTLYRYWRRECPWADTNLVSAHWLRHTTATKIERKYGRAVAHRFLRHSGGDVTDGYVKATEGDLARAVQWLTGETHPLSSHD